MAEKTRTIMAHYHEQRDYPAAEGTSRLSVHLRFGTISVRELAREAYLDAGRGAQAQKFDPDGEFIRKHVPELAGCSDKFIHMPWLMTPEQQSRAGVTIGKDYPAPVVDHAIARRRALEIYRSVKKR